MSDECYVWACPDLVGDAAHQALEGLRAELAERGIVEDRLTDCISGEELGYPPGPNVGDALAFPAGHLLQVRPNGLELTVTRKVAGPYGEVSEGTVHTCRSCGASHDLLAEVDLDELGPWSDGEIDEVAVTCPSCGHRAPFGELDLNPPWCLAEMVVRVWNWAIPQPWLVEVVTSHLTPRTISYLQRV